MIEPEYIAYRIDLKRFKEFYSLEDAARFFNIKPISAERRAIGEDANHLTGKKIGEKWLIFNASKPVKYVEDIINSLKEEKINY